MSRDADLRQFVAESRLLFSSFYFIELFEESLLYPGLIKLCLVLLMIFNKSIIQNKFISVYNFDRIYVIFLYWIFFFPLFIMYCSSISV